MNELENELLKIDIFSIYNNLIPYIGKSYKQYKILIIGESHFLEENVKEQIKDDFYEGNLDKYEPYIKENINILNNSYECTRKKLHPIHKNILNALKNNNLDYTNIAYYNFFLKPAKYRTTINLTKKDIEVANNVIKEIINILTPRIIIFVSKKAYLNYHNREKNSFYVQHPTCHWWHKKSTNQKLYGKEKFIDIISKNIYSL